jgi:hypothetical protein
MGVGKRQRTHQDGVDGASNGRVGPDSERQGQDGDKAEAWGIPKLPDCVTEIMYKPVHGTDPGDFERLRAKITGCTCCTKLRPLQVTRNTGVKWQQISTGRLGLSANERTESGPNTKIWQVRFDKISGRRPQLEEISCFFTDLSEEQQNAANVW